jgi:SAM-dependent methyltransferase
MIGGLRDGFSRAGVLCAPPMSFDGGQVPEWFLALLGLDAAVGDGHSMDLGGTRYVLDRGVLRAGLAVSEAQGQTADAFAFKWQRLDTFAGEVAVGRSRRWLLERYGDVASAPWWRDYGDAPVLLDAGCGAALSSLALFGSRLKSVRFIAVDISEAVLVAAQRCCEHGIDGVFLQADLATLPLAPGTVDVIFCEGVLHHTDSPRASLARLASLLAPGGRFLFYVYRKKGPIREFTDDYIRGALQDLAPEEAWKALEPLTKLGVALGRLGAEVEIPEAIDLLEIPAGRYDIQRLFYWHVAKAFFRPELSFDELNHINYDWYAPANAHRQTPEEVRSWCAESGLEIEHEHVEDAGITVIARRR